jgi:hypothetical protein
MTKRTLAKLLSVLLITPALGLAHATPAEPFNLADVAGKWAGVASGTFLGLPFATNFVLDVDRSGSAAFTLDSTVGPVTSDCTIFIQGSGFGIAHCTDTSGPTTGAVSDTHFVITDGGRKITGWTSVPSFGYFTTTTAYRQ